MRRAEHHTTFYISLCATLVVRDIAVNIKWLTLCSECCETPILAKLVTHLGEHLALSRIRDQQLYPCKRGAYFLPLSSMPPSEVASPNIMTIDCHQWLDKAL